MSGLRKVGLVLGALATLFVAIALSLAVTAKSRWKARLEAYRQHAQRPREAEVSKTKGGVLIMGRGRDAPNGPEHIVRIDPFAIDTTEVTAAAFAECVVAVLAKAAAPRSTPPATLCTGADPAKRDHPAIA